MEGKHRADGFHGWDLLAKWPKRLLLARSIEPALVDRSVQSPEVACSPPASRSPLITCNTVNFRMPSLINLIPDSCFIKIPEASLSLMKGKRLTTRKRAIAQVPGLEWCLSCHPAGETDTVGYVCLYLTVSKPVDMRIVINVEGSEIRHRDIHRFASDGQNLAFDYKTCVSHKELRKRGTIREGKFVITCNVEFEMPLIELGPLPPIHELLLDTCPQVTLEFKKETVPINKAVLTSVSYGFNNMFIHNTEEAKTGRVKINDFDSATAVMAFNLCYGMKIRDKTWNEFISMEKFADSYGIEGLQEYNKTKIFGKASGGKVEKIRKGLLEKVCDSKTKAALNTLATDADPPKFYELLLDTCPKIVVNVGGLTVEISKILAYISPVLNKKFGSDTEFGKAASDNIDDFDVETVANVEKFCLGCELPNFTLDECIEMLKFAEKYEILRMQEYFECGLMKIISDDNICKIAGYAWAHSRDDVKKKCVLHFSQLNVRLLSSSRPYEQVMSTTSLRDLDDSIMTALINGAAELLKHSY